MWRKIKEILCKHTAYKDESTSPTVPGTITASVIDLKSLPGTSSRRGETLHHHRAYRKATSKSTLNKTDEHCRSLFNLLPTSFRSRHQHQQQQQQPPLPTFKNKGIDASTTTAEDSSSMDVFATDHDSGYMSQSVLNRTASYASCYSAVATTAPISSVARHGSIESLLHGHSRSNPASIRAIVRKNFEPFAQAHVAVTQGTIVTVLFSRGPWLYIRIDSSGQTGYIPRIICSLYRHQLASNENAYYHHRQHPLSLSSTDSSPNRDDELDLTMAAKKNDKYFIRPYQQQEQQQHQQINRYLSHSTAMLTDQHTYQEHSRKQFVSTLKFDERERRNTCTLPPPLPSTSVVSSRDRRLTFTSNQWPASTKKPDPVGIHHMNDVSTTTHNAALPARDTDSSSTQDSGYSESTPYFLVQQATQDLDHPSARTSLSKSTTSSPHVTAARRSSLLKVPDTMMAHHSSLRRHQPQASRSTRHHPHRHTLLNGISYNDIITTTSSTATTNANKRHSCGTFFANDAQTYEHTLFNANQCSTVAATHSLQRPIEFALIRNVRRDKDETYQRLKPSIHNLPKSHRQIPASIFLNHHRQQQQQQQQQKNPQFGSSHSAFKPVQPTTKAKRASSEGHSPSNEHPTGTPAGSTPASSLSSSVSSLTSHKNAHSSKHRRLSCDLPSANLSKINSGSLTRSVCDQMSSTKFNPFSRTMSDILCDQFSEINLDAIEKDSLQQPLMKKLDEERFKKFFQSPQCLFTIVKDYRSSRASFSVKRGDHVHVLKQVGRACFLVRKQNNGHIGFLPKALLQPSTTTRIDTFLEMHGYRETVI